MKGPRILDHPTITMNFLGTSGAFAMYGIIKAYADHLEAGGLDEFDHPLDAFEPHVAQAIRDTAQILYTRDATGTTVANDREIRDELRLDCPDYVLILTALLQ